MPNYIQIFNDTVVKMSINQGLESQRDTETLGSFTVGELAYTRDSGRVFVGDYTDADHPGQQMTKGGSLVGNKYLGSIDSKTIEIFNDNPSRTVKSLDYISNTKPDVYRGEDAESYSVGSYVSKLEENGVVVAGTKFKIQSDNFDKSQDLTETNWSRWDRYNTYNEQYDAFNGDYLYDKFENALILFDKSVKPMTKTDVDFVRSGWSHINYGPSFEVWLAKAELEFDDNGTVSYDNVQHVYPFKKVDINNNTRFLATSSDGEYLIGADGNYIEVYNDKSYISFFKNAFTAKGDSRKRTEIAGNWDDVWYPTRETTDNDNLVKVKGVTDVGMCKLSPVYLDKDGQPFEIQSESKQRTMLINRDERYPVYGDGYVIIRNIEPDNDTIGFKEREGYEITLNNDASGEMFKSVFDDINKRCTSSNVLTVKRLSDKVLTQTFSEDFEIAGGQVYINSNLAFDSVSSQNLYLPSRLTLSNDLTVNRWDGVSPISGMTINFDTSVAPETRTPQYVFGFERNERDGMYNAFMTPASAQTITINLGDGLITDAGLKTITCRVGDTNTPEIRLDGHGVESISPDKFDIPQDDATYMTNGVVRYVGTLVVNSSGNVIDSDKYYNGDNSDVAVQYRNQNSSLNYLKSPKPLVWAISNTSEDTLSGFTSTFTIHNNNIICTDLTTSGGDYNALCNALPNQRQLNYTMVGRHTISEIISQQGSGDDTQEFVKYNISDTPVITINKVVDQIYVRGQNTPDSYYFECEYNGDITRHVSQIDILSNTGAVLYNVFTAINDVQFEDTMRVQLKLSNIYEELCKNGQYPEKLKITYYTTESVEEEVEIEQGVNPLDEDTEEGDDTEVVTVTVTVIRTYRNTVPTTKIVNMGARTSATNVIESDTGFVYSLTDLNDLMVDFGGERPRLSLKNCSYQVFPIEFGNEALDGTRTIIIDKMSGVSKVKGSESINVEELGACAIVDKKGTVSTPALITAAEFNLIKTAGVCMVQAVYDPNPNRPEDADASDVVAGKCFLVYVTNVTGPSLPSEIDEDVQVKIPSHARSVILGLHSIDNSDEITNGAIISTAKTVTGLNISEVDTNVKWFNVQNTSGSSLPTLNAEVSAVISENETLLRKCNKNEVTTVEVPIHISADGLHYFNLVGRNINAGDNAQFVVQYLGYRV